MKRWTFVISFVMAGSGGLATGLAGQTTDTTRAAVRSVSEDSLRVVVEYVGGPNLYLNRGAEAGLESKDTVDVLQAPGNSRGKLRVLDSGDGRSVVAFVGQPFPVTRGDTLTILRAARQPPVAAPSSGSADHRTAGAQRIQHPAAAAATPRPTAPQSSRSPYPVNRSPRLDGSVALDVDATSSRAAGEPGAEPWQFVTPTARLHATASGLPGGVRMLVNASWARYFANGTVEPGRTGHLRIYQAEIAKTFANAPLQLRAGRFFDRHDVWGGYLDGASVRLGGARNGPGIGVSAGMTPVGADHDLFSGSSRFSVFADFRHRADRFGYDVDVAFTRRTWTEAPADRYLGLTQRLRFGTATIYQRARVEIDPVDNSPELTQFDLMSVWPLGSGWMMRGQFQRRSYAWVVGSGVMAVQHRERAGAGVSWSGRAGSLSLDAQFAQWGDRPRAPMYGGSLFLPRLLGPVGLTANANINRDPGIRSTWLSPGFLLQEGRWRATLSWQFYRTVSAGRETETNGASFSLSVPLRHGLHASIRGEFRSGAGSSSQRLYSGLWASF